MRLRANAGVAVASLALGIAASACCGEQQPSQVAAPLPSQPDPSPIPAGSEQLVLGIAASWDASSVVLRRFERTRGGDWREVGQPWDGVVGRAGVGWGRGLHGDGAPAGQRGPVKAEGDGRAPAGVFAIGRAYGYDAQPSVQTRMPYTHLAESWRCVDDPASTSYNRVLDATGVVSDWQSAEVMRRDDDLYRWVLEIDHNQLVARAHATPRPGEGSCIFFHVWAGPDQPTAGCTAMPTNRIQDLLLGLDPAQKPVYALLPADAYRVLAQRWALPQP